MAICCVVRPPHRLGGVARSRSLFVATPPLILRGLPANGISQSSTCICLPAEASAQAGPFLSNLEDMTFSTAFNNGETSNHYGDTIDP